MTNAAMTTAEITCETEAPKRKPRKKADDLSQRGLDAAVRFLTRRGYDVLATDWRCRAGKADIIARDEDTLIFIEVKTRKDNEQGFPVEGPSAEKRTKFEKIALAFLADYEVVDLAVRFDMISIVVVASERAMIRHHIAALSAC